MEARAYEREFKGVTHFEPISRKHTAFINILHVGRNEKAGYFYCIMELADDGVRGPTIDPPSYVPHTLAWEVDEHGPLRLDRCLQIALTLAAGLQYLHDQGLVHRDLKPANIIFANERWKLADIGLVTNISEAATTLGTPGYMAPEGPGNPAADIFALGMVLYKISTGRNPADFPAIPTELTDDEGRWRRFYDLVRIACQQDRTKRFQSAKQMSDHFAKLCLASDAAPGHERTLPAVPDSQTVVLLHQPGVQPDEYVCRLFQSHLAKHAHQIIIDGQTNFDVQWARGLEARMAKADAVIALVSPTSAHSEALTYEIEAAYDAARRRQGKPSLLPVRVQNDAPLPGALASVLGALPAVRWSGPQDDERLLASVFEAIESPAVSVSLERREEQDRGAVPVDSPYYVERSTDEDFNHALARRDSLV